MRIVIVFYNIPSYSEYFIWTIHWGNYQTHMQEPVSMYDRKFLFTKHTHTLELSIFNLFWMLGSTTFISLGTS